MVTPRWYNICLDRYLNNNDIRGYITLIRCNVAKVLQRKTHRYNVIYRPEWDLERRINNILKSDKSFFEQKIHNTNVSYFDIVAKPKETVAKYMRNENVLQEIELHVLETSDYYYDIIDARNRALIRRDLENFAISIFKNYFNISVTCSDEIVSHLTDDDLRKFSRIWKH